MDEFLWSTGDDRLVITARGEAAPAAAEFFELTGARGAVPHILPPTPRVTAPGGNTAPVAQAPAVSMASAILGRRFAARWRSSARRRRTQALGSE